MTLIAYIFLKLQTTKNVVRQMAKKSRFRRPLEKQHGKRSQTLLKSERLHFYHIHWSLRREWSWKKLLLVICKILGLFVNTLTADDKYSLLNRNNLTQSIQMKLSKKQKTVSDLFSLSFKSRLIFKLFKKKVNPIAYGFPKLRIPVGVVRQIPKKFRFRRPYDKQHGKRSQTFEVCTTPPLSYILINLKEIE